VGAEFDAARGAVLPEVRPAHEAVTAVTPATRRVEHLLDTWARGKPAADEAMRRRMVDHVAALPAERGRGQPLHSAGGQLTSHSRILELAAVFELVK